MINRLILKDLLLAVLFLASSSAMACEWARSPGNMQQKISSGGIEDFRIDPTQCLAGAKIFFTVQGERGAKAEILIEELGRKVTLSEVEKGRYEGYYTIRQTDLESMMSPTFKAMLVSKGKTNTAYLFAQPEVATSQPVAKASQPAALMAQPVVVQQPVCANCGKVESVSVQETQAQGPSVGGMIAGGVLGGVLGHQLGKGRGKQVATVAGAAGGAYAGNEVGKSLNKQKSWAVSVRMDDGSQRRVNAASDPGVQNGDRVTLGADGSLSVIR